MDSLNLDQHISKQFNTDLERLRTQLLEMGGLVEDQIKNSTKALETGESAVAEKVMNLEEEVDKREVTIDHECATILARRQPAASDLRLVLMVIKATRDLERMGDEANGIARMAVALNEEKGENFSGFSDVRHLASSVITSVHNALDAFARFDVQAAIQVMRDDKRIDNEYKTSLRAMITYMMEDPRSISRVMNVLWILRALERIGDHARNIAEHVIYLVQGTDVRHTSLKKIEAQINVKN